MDYSQMASTADWAASAHLRQGRDEIDYAQQRLTYRTVPLYAKGPWVPPEQIDTYNALLEVVVAKRLELIAAINALVDALPGEDITATWVASS